MSKAKCALILGMHRSGTSAFTGVLKLAGFYLNDEKLLGSTHSNEKGHWEHLGVLLINEKILSYFNSSWYDIHKLPMNWFNDPAFEELKIEARELLKNDFGNITHWALKEPRLCRLLPFWLPLLKEAADIYCLHIIRNPLEVAASLKKRDKMPNMRSYLLWLQYNLMAEAATRNLPRAFINYDKFLVDPISNLQRIENQAQLPFPQKLEEQASAIKEFLTSELRHHQRDLQEIHSAAPAALQLNEIYKILTKENQLTAQEKIFLTKKGIDTDFYCKMYQNQKHTVG